MISGSGTLTLEKTSSLDTRKDTPLHESIGQNCCNPKIIFSEKRKAIAAEAMQILKTMNDDVLVALLGYVAKVADKYERDGLGHDKH